jgi:hypothetical protein
VALRRGHTSVTPEAFAENKVHVLFGTPRRLDLWSLRLERKLAAPAEWGLTNEEAKEPAVLANGEEGPEHLFLPLIVQRDKKTMIMDESVELEQGDRLVVLIYLERQEEADRWLREHGWTPFEEVAAKEEAETSVP